MKKKKKQRKDDEKPLDVRITNYEDLIPKKEEKKDKKKISHVEPIDIKDLPSQTISFESISSNKVDEKNLKDVYIRYPLTPVNPKPGEQIFAWTEIKWDPKINSLRYYVHEPVLSSEDKKELKRIKQIIEDKIDVNFEKLEQRGATEYLKKLLDEIIRDFELKLSTKKKAEFEYYILRDFIGLSKIQPLMNDTNIEDISCDGVKIPIFVYHRNPKIGSLQTNVVFDSKEELDEFIIKLAQRANKTVSVASPILEGAARDGSRIHATLGTDIARRGSNFTIRRFTENPLTPIDLIKFGSMNEIMMAYFWLLIEYGKSILISGATAAGKTSLLNALSLFIKPTAKIVSIEDTPELRLPHTHWIPEVERSGFGVISSSGERMGQVTMFELLKGALRQRPDYIIVGEVRGKEASVLFQGMATGHAGLATIHADSMEKVIDRLTTPPINLPASLLETLDVIIFAKRLKYKEKYVRRVASVHEIKGYDYKNNRVKYIEPFEWNSNNDTFTIKDASIKLGKLKEDVGMSDLAIKEELITRANILKWMKRKNIVYYKDVGEIINQFYTFPEALLERIKEDI